MRIKVLLEMSPSRILNLAHGVHHILYIYTIVLATTIFK